MVTKKDATYQSGKNKGKLKPGYRYGKNGRIIEAKKAAHKSTKKRKPSASTLFQRKAKSTKRKLFKLFK
ncbi:hypothetical protein [Celerinatantimonas sp. YJH-8]|uniref:hypothetical protein n=1 Tax=Celerinatantimonas sp. YJH-8 TaxID=3228714 RepID=UPI0038CB1715